VPKWSAQTLVQYIGNRVFLPHDQVIGSFASTFVGSRNDITTSGTIMDHQAYWRFDAVTSYALGQRWGWLENEQVFVRVQNLLDARYSEAFGFRSPPINFVAGVKMDLQ